MDGTYDSEMDPNVYTYATHDLNIAVIMRVLSGYDFPPTYGSALLFELHFAQGQFVFKLFSAKNYHDSGFYKIEQVNINVCQGDNDLSCDLSVLNTSVHHLYPIDWIPNVTQVIMLKFII